MKIKLKIAIFIASNLMLNASLSCQCNSSVEIERIEMQCNEEPLKSLEFPIKHANAVVQHAQGNVINGQVAVLIRLVDFAEKEYFFAVLRDAHSATYQTVVTNLPLSWNDESEYLGGFEIPHDLKIPEDLFREDQGFIKLKSAELAVSDLINILNYFRDVTDGQSNVAFEYLKGEI